LIDKKRLTFSEFDEKHYGEELTPNIRNRIKAVWNQEIEDPWYLSTCEGVETHGYDDKGDLIYTFNPKALGEGYHNIIEMVGE
ncbi:unnamed protein product, partial [marine sediment metagenome]